MTRLENVRNGASVSGLVPNQSVEAISVEWIGGHPLLDAAISIVREQNDYLIKQGDVLVDDTDEGTDVSALYLLEHSKQDGRPTSSGNANIISQKLQFAAIDEADNVTNAAIAPHLNLRPATPEEIGGVEDVLNADCLRGGLEKKVVHFATGELAQGHVADVRARRFPEIDKVEHEVKTRRNWQNAQRRAEDLAERLKRRLELIDQERFIVAQPPRMRGGMVVVPRGLLRERMPAEKADAGSGFSEDPAARREIEMKAMEAVMAVERELGNRPEDVSAQKAGYDIASCDPNVDHMRFIEVKGRIDGADTVMITRQQVITSLHEPEKFILAIVQVGDGYVHAPRYLRGALDTREPPFDQSAIKYNINRL